MHVVFLWFLIYGYWNKIHLHVSTVLCRWFFSNISRQEAQEILLRGNWRWFDILSVICQYRYSVLMLCGYVWSVNFLNLLILSVLSYLAFKWKWGWSWPCYDTWPCCSNNGPGFSIAFQSTGFHSESTGLIFISRCKADCKCLGSEPSKRSGSPVNYYTLNYQKCCLHNFSLEKKITNLIA